MRLKRTNVVRLVASKEVEKKLRELALWTAKCWNEVNWLRMQQFKEGKRVDFNGTEKEVYTKYKQYLKVNASQVCRKNAEAWRSFFSLIKAKKDGKLPNKPRPPGYWKDKRGKYKLIILVRNDRYILNEEKQEIHLKDSHLTLKFRGKLKWKGKQGRLEIFHDGIHWYASIPIKVETSTKPKGDSIAGTDLGIVNLAAVAFSDGTWALFKGGSVLAQYENYSRKIASVQKKLSIHGQVRSKKLRRMYLRRKRFLRHALNSMVRSIVRLACEKGVGVIKVGYPKDIARRCGNKLTVGFWNYGYIIRRFYEVGEEYGVRVALVDERRNRSSKVCSLCGEAHLNGRVFRGLFKCPHGGVINADLNSAVNHIHIPESQGRGCGGSSPGGIGVIWLKTQPLVYRWMSGAGWVSVVKPTSYEVMRMKAVNHKPVNRPKGTLAL